MLNHFQPTTMRLFGGISLALLVVIGWRWTSGGGRADDSLDAFPQTYQCAACTHRFAMTPSEARAWSRNKPSSALPEQSRKFTCPSCNALAVTYYEEPIL